MFLFDYKNNGSNEEDLDTQYQLVKCVNKWFESDLNKWGGDKLEREQLSSGVKFIMPTTLLTDHTFLLFVQEADRVNLIMVEA